MSLVKAKRVLKADSNIPDLVQDLERIDRRDEALDIGLTPKALAKPKDGRKDLIRRPIARVRGISYEKVLNDTDQLVVVYWKVPKQEEPFYRGNTGAFYFELDPGDDTPTNEFSLGLMNYICVRFNMPNSNEIRASCVETKAPTKNDEVIYYQASDILRSDPPPNLLPVQAPLLPGPKPQLVPLDKAVGDHGMRLLPGGGQLVPASVGAAPHKVVKGNPFSGPGGWPGLAVSQGGSCVQYFILGCCTLATLPLALIGLTKVTFRKLLFGSHGPLMHLNNR